MSWDLQNKLYSVANRTAMTYGSISYRNVRELLRANPELKPFWVHSGRFAAMVVQAFGGHNDKGTP